MSFYFFVQHSGTQQKVLINVEVASSSSAQESDLSTIVSHIFQSLEDRSSLQISSVKTITLITQNEYKINDEETCHSLPTEENTTDWKSVPLPSVDQNFAVSLPRKKWGKIYDKLISRWPSDRPTMVCFTRQLENVVAHRVLFF